MKIVALIFLQLIALCLSDANIKTEDEVLVLTKGNFNDAITDNEFILVEFYAPWCGHCKSLAPEYAKAAKQLIDQKSDIKLGKVDATEESSLAEEFGVRGYPTLKFFRNGTPIEYSGGRQGDEIVNWLLKKTGPPAVELKTVDEIENFIKDHNVVVIGYLSDADTQVAKTLLSVASSVDEYPFGIVNDKALFGKQDAKDDSIVLHKKFDEGKTVFDGEPNEEQLKQFITVQSMPLIVDFNHDSAQKIFGGAIKNHLLVFLSKSAGHIDQYTDALRELAKDYRKDILFVSINTDEEDHKRILEFFGMKKEEVPSMRIIRLQEDMDKYKPATADLSAESVKSFVDDFLSGKLKQHLLSQEVPDDWDAEPVKILVSTNFDEVVYADGKDVLVEFYAPWCGHCKQLAPIYDQLAEQFKDSETLIIAKIDATANEVEHTKITMYPTIQFYKKEDKKNPIQYNGERTLEALTKFVESRGDEADLPEETKTVDEKDDNVKDEL